MICSKQKSTGKNIKIMSSLSSFFKGLKNATTCIYEEVVFESIAFSINLTYGFCE
jgi:hypothetical protein